MMVLAKIKRSTCALQPFASPTSGWLLQHVIARQLLVSFIYEMPCAGAAQAQVDALGAEAAWRVGNLDLLAEYVQGAEDAGHVLDAQDEWEVKLGRLLCGRRVRRPRKEFIHKVDGPWTWSNLGQLDRARTCRL